MLYYERCIEQAKEFSKKLKDDESRELWDARVEYYFEHDEDKLLERIVKVAGKYRDTFSCWGLDQYYVRHPENRNKPFIVFGAGNMGKQTIRTLELLNKKIDCVVDNAVDCQGAEVCGYMVCHPSSIQYRDRIVVVAVSRGVQIDIYYQLLELGINESNIIMHQEGGLYLDFGTQYFDVAGVVPTGDGEIFVDAGCYDGLSSVNAARWADGNLKKVYAFEPDKNSLGICEKNLKSIGCEYELHNLATWDRRDVLCFDVQENAGYGSKVSEIGESVVDADSIDNILEGRPVTYIKLDVEGSELRTLHGAVKSISKWRPQLAISIYHKPEDIIEIPAFLESLNCGYEYYIRQYQSRKFETTLYAV